MPNLLFRHGQTDKNITKGTVDNHLTFLNAVGMRQAHMAGYMLRDYCQENGICLIQPVISAFPGKDGDPIPFSRTLQTVSLLLAPVQQFLPRISIDEIIPDIRSRDIKLKKRGTETGSQRLFSDHREIDGEELWSVEQRIGDYYHDYLAVKSDPDTLVLSVCHTTVSRFMVAEHFNRPLNFVEDNVPDLNNLQGLEFAPGMVRTVFEGFALSEAQRAELNKLRPSGNINIMEAR